MAVTKDTPQTTAINMSNPLFSVYEVGVLLTCVILAFGFLLFYREDKFNRRQNETELRVRVLEAQVFSQQQTIEKLALSPKD